MPIQPTALRVSVVLVLGLGLHVDLDFAVRLQLRVEMDFLFVRLELDFDVGGRDLLLGHGETRGRDGSKQVQSIRKDLD